jgi:GNAT superfamily N-acetyltransferase
MMGVALRPMQDADAVGVASVLDSLWGNDHIMRQVYDLHGVWPAETTVIRQTLVAVAEETIVGVGTVFENTIHPLRLTIVVNIKPMWQRKGIGLALYNALIPFGDGRAWQAKALRRDAASMAFLLRCGFIPIMTTLTGVIDPADPVVNVWLATLSKDLPEEYAFTPSGVADELALLFGAVYRQYHPWSPPAPFSSEQAHELFCGSDLLPWSIMRVTYGGDLVGVGGLYAERADEAYLCTVGVVNLPDDVTFSLTERLIHDLIKLAGVYGLRVRFEADAAYWPHYAILATAPAQERDDDFTILATPS